MLYGGAGYGGKSDALRTATLELNATLAQLGFPGRWGALFCETYRDLADRIVRKLQRESEPGRPSLSKYGEVKKDDVHGWYFRFFDPALGGFYLRNLDDSKKYKGAEFDWVLVDEVTTITRDQFSDVLYTLRSSSGQPFLPFGAATNPDGVGHAWVKKLWIERDFSGEPSILDPEDFIFVPAKAWDNPTFNQSVEQRIRGHSDPLIVEARWNGSWDLNTGARFSKFSRGIHVVDWDWFEREYRCVGQSAQALLDPALFTLYGSLDYGTSNDAASVFLVHAVDYKKNVFTVAELWMAGTYLSEQAALISQVTEKMKLRKVYCDPSLKGKSDSGISRIRAFRELGVSMVPASNDRVEGWATMDRFLEYRSNGEEMVPPRWRILGDCKNLIRELVSAPRDDKRHEDVDQSFEDDHALDSARYFFHTHFRGPGTVVQPPVVDSLEWYARLGQRQENTGFSYVSSIVR